MNIEAEFQITLEGCLPISLPLGSTVADLLQETGKINPGVIGIRLGHEILDVQSPLTHGGSAKIITLSEDSPEAKLMYRHSFSHVLAQAVKRLFPEAKLAIGPATGEGYYYDFDVSRPFTPEDLEKISAEMEKIIAENHVFKRTNVTTLEAEALLNKLNEPYKLELVEQFKSRGEKLSFYQDGEFIDLCRGPHVPSTGLVKNFKLLDVAGAYWRGDEKRKMLQRIYGTAFLNKKDLSQHLHNLEEARKRDHRKIGRELDLYSIRPDEIGPGLILWHPRGGLVRYLVEEHCRKRHLSSGYQFVYSPHIGKSDLWKTSGHLEFYKDGMFSAIDIEGQEYYLKPMNCPFHCNIYKDSLKSYRNLPLRLAEWGTVYRYERSGTLQGLTRVRGFTQDDAHLFCHPDQMPEEIDQVLDFSLSLLRDFGFSDFHLYLSTRPEKRVGREEQWDAAETALRNSLERSNLPFSINEADGAFYGPKIDICLRDAIGREWQLSTIQFDFNLPERFDLKFTASDGKEARPYMVHRALLGSMERFFALLIEHHAGNFPVWLSPVQVKVIPISEVHKEYADKVVAQLKESSLRVELDDSNQTLNYRIRNAQQMKTPFMIIVGDREAAEGQISVRLRNGKNLDDKSIDGFLRFAKETIESKQSI